MSNGFFKSLVVLVGGVVLGSGSFWAWTAVGSTSTTFPEAIETTTTTATSTTTSTSTSTTIPPPITTTVPPKGTLVIHGTGDVAVDPVYIPALAHNGWDHAWAGLDRLFERDDLTVINLECVPSDLGNPLDKAFTFRCPPASLPSMRAHGVDVANLANNHSADFGQEALLDGRAQLIAHQIASVGVGQDHAEAGEAAVFEINGWRVAVVGFGGVIPSTSWVATEERAGMRHGKDTAGMVEAVRAAKEKADIVVVTIHWGRELDTSPRPDDIANARAMIEAGANVIFGHHQHRLGPMEMIDGAAVFWGLGNFVWPHLSIASATTAVARVVVNPDGSLEACMIPAFIATHGQPTLTGEPECGPGS